MTFKRFESQWCEAVEDELANIKRGILEHDENSIINMCAIKTFLREIFEDNSLACGDYCPFCVCDGCVCYSELNKLMKLFNSNDHIVRQLTQYFIIAKKLRTYQCKDLYNRHINTIQKRNGAL